MTLGIQYLGLFKTMLLQNKITEAFKGSENGLNPPLINMDDPRQLFQSDARSQIPDFVLEKIVQSMSDSITLTFSLALIPIVLAVVVILFMGKSKAQIEQSP